MDGIAGNDARLETGFLTTPTPNFRFDGGFIMVPNE